MVDDAPEQNPPGEEPSSDASDQTGKKKQKKKGKRVIQDEEPDRIPKGSNVVDLMAALKKSLGDEKPKAKASVKKGTAKPAARRSPAKKAAPKRAAGGRGR